MRLLQRYILKEIVRNFAFLLIVLTVLLVFVGVVRQAKESGLGAAQIIQVLPFVVLSLLPFTIPATLLLTVCVVYGRIAADQEITAAKAAGINILSLLWPSFLLGAVLSVCSLWLTDQIIPWAVGRIQETIAMALEDIFLERLRSSHHVTDKERGYSISVMDVIGKKLIGPTFTYTRQGGEPVTIQAQEATLEFDLQKQEVILHLVRGAFGIPGRSDGVFEKEDQPFSLPHSIPPPKPRHLSIQKIRSDLGELRRTISDREHRRNVVTALALSLNDIERLCQQDLIDYGYYQSVDRAKAAKLDTEIHSRLAMSTSCFFFVLLGGPFAIIRPRRQFLTSFLLCFLPILLIYYPVVLLMMNLSKTETVAPTWAMWIANGILLVAGIVVLHKVFKH